MRIAVVGDLRQIVAGIVVALDDGGALLRHADVPAHIVELRIHQRRLQRQRLDLLVHGHLIALQLDTGGGVPVVLLQLLVVALPGDLAGVQIEPHGDAAPAHVVKGHSAGARLAGGVDHQRLAVLHEGGHADAVDGIGMQRRRLGMLANDLLADAEPLLRPLHIGPHGIHIVEILLVQLLNAAAAVPVDGLDDHRVLVRQKRLKLLRVGGKQIQRLTAHQGPELLKEGILVVEDGGVGAVVHPPHEGSRPHTGQIRGALRVVQVVKFKHHIVRRAGAVALGAPQHVGKQRRRRLAADGVRLLGGLPDPAQRHVLGRLTNGTQFHKGKTSFHNRCLLLYRICHKRKAPSA